MATGRKAAQAEATRRELLDVARALFAERGYAGTSIEELVARARVTKGALYHHFRDKHDVFTTVFEELEREIVEKINAAALSKESGWERVVAASHAFLDGCLEPAVQQIVLLDAPAVLGWEKWREIDAQHSLGHVRASLRAAMNEGSIDRQATKPLAHLLIGALNEAALLIARAPNPKRARAEIGAGFDRLLDGLRSGRHPPS